MSTATEPQLRFWQRHSRQKPPPPLDATLMRHPLRWLKNRALVAVDGLALLHVGTLIVVALYYLAFQTIPGVKYDWDHALTGQLHFWGIHVHLALLSKAHWAEWRHLIRNVGEGLLGGVLAQAIIWNHFRVKPKPRNRVDRLEIALHIPNLKEDRRTSGWQMLALPPLVLVYAVPGFAIGAGVARLIQHGIAHVHVHQVSSDAVVQSLWTGTVSQKVVGLFASIVFARRVGRAVYDDVQLFFAERRRAAGKPLAFYHKLVPTFAARYNSITSTDAAAAAAGARDRWATWILVASIPIGIGLAAFGYYVLAYIATGKV
ncbi:MAG TPA: hypothetical protein VGY97_11320 [Solirubrobacteraceae bacterium]|jgi:hypothetical protein|nr:hypothetical protein [Solirubrobacteraceae bacterium]